MTIVPNPSLVDAAARGIPTSFFTGKELVANSGYDVDPFVEHGYTRPATGRVTSPSILRPNASRGSVSPEVAVGGTTPVLGNPVSRMQAAVKARGPVGTRGSFATLRAQDGGLEPGRRIPIEMTPAGEVIATSRAHLGRSGLGRILGPADAMPASPLLQGRPPTTTMARMPMPDPNLMLSPGGSSPNYYRPRMGPMALPPLPGTPDQGSVRVDESSIIPTPTFHVTVTEGFGAPATESPWGEAGTTTLSEETTAAVTTGPSHVKRYALVAAGAAVALFLLPKVFKRRK